MCMIGKTQLLCMQCRGIGPHLAARGKSHEFSRVASGTLYILEIRREWQYETRDCSATSGLLSSYEGHLGKLNYAWQENIDASGGEPGGQASLISWHSYIVIPINFHKSEASSPFEAMKSAQLSMCQKDVRPSVQKRWRTMAFSRVSTGDLVIPSL